MAEELNLKQTDSDVSGRPSYPTDSYAKGRPSYPASLFEKLASLTERHELAWDVGTGNGQSAIRVAEHYKSVIATDVSEQQLAQAKPRANVKYSQMSATPPWDELERIVGAEGSVDLVTVATAVHWFDLDKFYPIVKRMLRKPGGVFAAWTYYKPRVNPEVDKLTDACYEAMSNYSLPQARLAVEGYKYLPFPFEPVSGRQEDPVDAAKQGVEVETLEMEMPISLEGLLHLWKSSSSVQRALEQGVNIIDEDTTESLKKAWGSPNQILTAKFTIFLLIGTVTKPASAD